MFCVFVSHSVFEWKQCGGVCQRQVAESEEEEERRAVKEVESSPLICETADMPPHWTADKATKDLLMKTTAWYINPAIIQLADVIILQR